MEMATLKVETREQSGKGAARTLRRKGSLPAIIYRAGKASSLAINEKELQTLLRHAEGRLSMLNLQFNDNTTKLAIVKDIQIHPVHGNILHMDFQEVAANEEITLLVGLNLVGEAIGVKRDKGILEHHLRQVEIKCVPEKVPSHIDIDISALEVNQSLHVSDIITEEGVMVLSDPKEVVVAITLPSIVVEAEEKEVEGGAAEAGEEGAEKAEGAPEKEES